MEKQDLAQERLDELKSRMNRCVCKYCGGELTVHLIEFSNIATSNLEIFCDKCNRIEYGVEKEIYQDAAYFVDNLIANGDETEPNYALNRRFRIARVCDIITWHDKQIGILDQNGFKIPIQYAESKLDCADGSIVILGDYLSETGGHHE